MKQSCLFIWTYVREEVGKLLPGNATQYLAKLHCEYSINICKNICSNLSSTQGIKGFGKNFCNLILNARVKNHSSIIKKLNPTNS